MIVEDYLAPRAADGPSGADLEYDPAFIDLMISAQPGRQPGSEELSEPNYKALAEKALAVLDRSHDLRAAVVLAQAKVKLEGYVGLAPVTAYVRGCLETWWDSCHPLLDADDDNDPTMRKNAVTGLADPENFLRLLRLAPLAEGRTFGRINLRDLAIVGNEIAPAPGAAVPDAASVAAAFKETPREMLAARLAAARSILADTRAIGAVFDDRTPGIGPDLDPLIRLLRRAVARLAEELGEPEEMPGEAAEADEAEAPAEAAADAPARAAAPVPGTIASQADVVAALDRIMAYYARQEPSSPIPLLLKRVRRLVGADFLTIMNDIVPQGTDTVRSLAGMTEEE
jgi:type VI secretion system protein ImpA